MVKLFTKSLFEPPESGKICFDGRVYSELEPDEKRTPHRDRNVLSSALFDQ
jgi:phospholipid/cholesterol/gamma-HCH transport system ATP-binding protein